jgi:hypothetical protein
MKIKLTIFAAMLVLFTLTGCCFSSGSSTTTETTTTETIVTLTEENSVEDTQEATESVAQSSFLKESLQAEMTGFSDNIFSFDYPSNWKIIDDAAIDKLLNTSMQGASRNDFDYIGGVYVGDFWEEDIGEAMLTIYIVSDSAFSSTMTEDQYNAVKSSYESQFGDRLLSIEKVSLDGFDAVDIKTIGKSEQTQSWAINATGDGEVYMLDLRAEVNQYVGYEPIFQDIVNSFKISK